MPNLSYLAAAEKVLADFGQHQPLLDQDSNTGAWVSIAQLRKGHE